MEDSWNLFANAMVSLNAARPGSLNAYLGGIKLLLKLFPSKWHAIVATDLIVRSERWLRIHEDIGRSSTPGFDDRAPWDYIIGISAFGREGPNAMWWQTQVVLPLTGSGLHYPGVPGAASSSSGSRGQSNKRPRDTSQKSSTTVSAQFCNAWNNGGCSDPCPAGRRHVCETCKGRHRTCEHVRGYGKGGKAGKNKGKGKYQDKPKPAESDEAAKR